MKVKYFTSLTIIFLLSFLLSQDRIGEWSSYTCPLDIRDLVVDDYAIYCATGGGLLKYSNDNFDIYTTTDGLIGVDISKIKFDKNNNIWIGGKSPNGFIQILNKNIQNINYFDFSLTEITHFWFSDSSSYVSFIDGQDVGLIKFNYVNDNWKYIDIYKNFPLQLNSINGIQIIGDTIFIGTNLGIYKASVFNNLKDPNTWSLAFPGLVGQINTMCTTNNGFAFNINEQVYIVEANDLSTPLILNLPYNFNYNKIKFDKENSFWGIKNKEIYTQNNDFQPIESAKILNQLIFHTDGDIVLGTDHGLLFIDQYDFSIIKKIPNSPATAKFTAIKVLEDGRFIGASNLGLSVKEESGWRNILEIKRENSDTINSIYDYSTFVADTISYDFGYIVTDIEEGPNGLIYLGIEGNYPFYENPSRKGGGIIIMDIDNLNNIAVIDTSILGWYGSIGYMVVKDIDFDLFGNLWVVNTYVTNKNTPLHVRDLQGEWKSYGSSETTVKISQSPISATFDNWSRVWISAIQADGVNLGIYPNGGIFMLSYNGSPQNPEFFEWNTIITNQTVWSIASTKNNRVYYLTPTGLNYYDINGSINPVINQNSYPYFPNISFGMGSKIKIDPNGNIWNLSSTQGVHVLLENTTYWPDINGLRSSVSPLLSDEVYDIDFDENKNLAYIATSKGVSILRIPFGIDLDSYSDMKIFPSPFIIPSNDDMIVSNLIYNSSMKIMTLDGLVLRTVNNQGISIDGDQLTWDGKDDSGNYVSSGVYLLAIYNDSRQSKFGKITVINN